MRGPRQTVSTAIPASSVITNDIPGTIAARETPVSAPKNRIASRPGRTARTNSPSNTISVCNGFANADGCSANRCSSAVARAWAASTTSAGGVHNPSPVSTYTSGPTSTAAPASSAACRFAACASVFSLTSGVAGSSSGQAPSLHSPP